MELFNNKYWFKGNTHTHTTLSDGILSPDESADIYRKHGYDFIAITDHMKLFKGYEADNFIVFPGAEYHINDFKSKKAYHIVGIGMKKDIEYKTFMTPQYYIDQIIKNSGFAIIGHPAWSLMSHTDIMGLKGYMGIEIWNTVSETKSARGDSSEIIDLLAAQGCRKIIFAADDTHFYDDELFGGYIMVNCNEFSSSDIIENIKEGNFYCSQGPEIKTIKYDNNKVYVETSPVEKIKFYTDTFYCDDRVCSGNADITYANYEIKDTDSVLRIECVDSKGKRAWSQFINFKK